MNILTSLQPSAKAVVIGASGGIGAALASALKLLKVIDGVSAKDTGGFFAWDGQTIPY